MKLNDDVEQAMSLVVLQARFSQQGYISSMENSQGHITKLYFLYEQGLSGFICNAISKEAETKEKSNFPGNVI